MDRNLLGSQERELKHLAEKHGMSVEQAKAIVRKSGSRSREEIENALKQHPSSGASKHK